MVSPGSTVRLKFILTDNWGDRVLYEEPITIAAQDGTGIYINNLHKYIDAFELGCGDALRDIARDINYRNKIKDVPTKILLDEIKTRER